MLSRGIAGAALCIWSAFSASVKRETRSAARRSGDRFGSRQGAWPGGWATAATPARQSTATANRFGFNLESPVFFTVSLNAATANGALPVEPVFTSGFNVAQRDKGGTPVASACHRPARKAAILVGRDGILRGDCQSPRVPVANRHAACQAAPQKNDVSRSWYLRVSDQFRPLDGQIADSLTRGCEDSRGERRGHHRNAGFPNARVRSLRIDYGYVDLRGRLFQSRHRVIVKIGLLDAARIGADFAHQSQRRTKNRRAFKLRADAVRHDDLANVGNRPYVGDGEIPLAVDGDFDRRGDVAQEAAVSRDADSAIPGVLELGIARFLSATLQDTAQAAGIEREGLRRLAVVPSFYAVLGQVDAAVRTNRLQEVVDVIRS